MIDDPVTIWLNELRNADPLAAAKLWEHFVGRIQGVARQKLKSESRRVYDEDDVALSVFHSICAGITAGRFTELQDRDCLWRLILVITSRKISHRHRYDGRECRNANRNYSNFIFRDAEGTISAASLGEVLSREPTPEFAAEFIETCELLLNSLDDPNLAQVVALRMEGYNDTEIAELLSCSRRTVQRRLEIIRRHLSRME
ncbi:ECF-type sigma factor [Planctomycetaceae bacterium SH139]